jgi:hypothetical protein
VNVRREGMGNPEPRKTTIQLACNNRAEQDWQDAQSERPARWHGLALSREWGEPVPIEPALLAKRRQDAESEPASSERRAGCPKRASGEMARARPEPRVGRTRSERPARWHGLAPSRVRLLAPDVLAHDLVARPPPNPQNQKNHCNRACQEYFRSSSQPRDPVPMDGSRLSTNESGRTRWLQSL